MKFDILGDLLGHYESLRHFANYSFTGSIKDIGSDEDENLKRYESLAFGFNPNSSDNPRGTYYGPFMTYTGDDGKYYESPSISFIDEDCIVYRRRRMSDTKSDFMRYRYADLVFDFALKILGDNLIQYIDEGYFVVAARHIVDCGIIILNHRLLEHEVDGKIYLERIIDVSIKIGKYRLSDIIATCIDFECQIAEDESPGLRGFSYNYLVKNKKVNENVSIEQKTKIIQDLEDRLKRLIDTHGSIRSIKHCVDNLLDYFKTEEIQIIRLLEIFEQEYRKDDHSNGSALLRQHYLEEIKDLYQYHNYKNRYAQKINNLIKEIKEVGKEVNEGLKTVGADFTITEAQMQQEIDKYYNKDKKEIILESFISGFVRSKKRSLKVLEESINNHPIVFLSTKVILDENGIIILKLPPVRENMEPHLIQQYQQDISIMNIFLDEVCNNIKRDYTIEQNILDSEIIKNLIRQDTINRLWGNYLTSNNLEFCHIGIPLIESIFRFILEKIGGTGIMSNDMG